MSLLSTIWADLQKLLAFAPVVAAVDPNAAGGIASAELAVAALKPTVEAVASANAGQLSHADMVTQVTNAIATTSASLVKQGLVSSTTDQHIQALAPAINAAVAISGLAAAPVTPAA
jgi:hypothetical protein